MWMINERQTTSCSRTSIMECFLPGGDVRAASMPQGSQAVAASSMSVGITENRVQVPTCHPLAAPPSRNPLPSRDNKTNHHI